MNVTETPAVLRESRLDTSYLQPLNHTDAAAFEAFVVPRYLSHFGKLAVDMLAPPADDGASLVHIGCRTGYPVVQALEKFPTMRWLGIDPSPSAIELSDTKMAKVPEGQAMFRIADRFPTPLPEGTYTHAMVLHPPGRASSRLHHIREASRLLVTGGQLVIALPLRGSFLEIADLLREYALKFDRKDVQSAIDAATTLRPTPETLAEEIERFGFDDVDVEFINAHVTYQTGRDFLEDAATRLLLLPEWRLNVDVVPKEFDMLFQYVKEAIDKYWSEGGFTLSIQVGCARGFLLD